MCLTDLIDRLWPERLTAAWRAWRAEHDRHIDDVITLDEFENDPDLAIWPDKYKWPKPLPPVALPRLEVPRDEDDCPF